MRRSPSSTRSTSLHSTSLATLLVAALTLWGCGGGGGGGGTGGEAGASGGAGGAAKGGTSGGGATGKGGAAGAATTGTGGAAGGTTTGNGGAAGGTTTGNGGAAGGTTTGNGGAAGGTTTGNGGAAGGTTTGNGGAAGGTTTGNGGAAGGSVGGAAGSGTTTCSTSGASCTTSGGITGICGNGTCGGCTASAACVSAYGTGYVCLTGSGSCVMGTCATNGDCNGKICGSSHTCTACTQASDCTAAGAYGTGYVCQTSTGTCVQGNCTANSDCGTGQLCGSGNTCTSCGTTDSACASYGTGYICVSGNCVMGTCHSGAQCQNGQICNSSHACAACTNDTGCQASYTDGRICDTTTGACIVGNCHTNTDCSNGVCVSNTCVNCTANNQCATGQVCITSSGTCVTGNCLTAQDCNDTTKVCASNNCGSCTATSDCTAAYGSNHVCNTSDQCEQGNCVTNADCVATGQICNTTALTCAGCGSGAAGDTACQTAYNSGYICSGGACVTGNCHDSTNCAAGQVCNLSTHTCGGCGSGTAGDTTCQGDTSRYGSTYICQANACIVGNCHVAANCNNTAQVCNNFTCGNCSATSDCTTAYGSAYVCNGAHQCVQGNCTDSSQCGGQLCIANKCTACTAGSTGDGQCTGDNVYGPMHICISGQCVAGNCHDIDGDCTTPGQICGITAAHMCGGCGSGTTGDNACKGDTTSYGANYICYNDTCQQGNCHALDSECPAGQICGVSTALSCGNCAAGTTGDTQCQTHFGSGDICYQGLCGAGNCHAKSSDCTGANAGLICGVSIANTCGSCTSDSQCKNDLFYTANDICNTTTGQCVSASCTDSGYPAGAACAANGTDICCGNGGTSGTCVAGTCCVDNDCGASGTACVNHACSMCNGVSGNKWYVDPVNGNDSTATGSDMAGSSVAPGCAFKTIKKLLNVMPSTPFAGTQIIIVGPASALAAGETYPITIPTNTTLTTAGGAVTIPVPAAPTAALFQLNNNASAITGGAGAALTLDGASHAGNIAILNSPATAGFTSSISNLTIQNTNNDSIRVTTGTLTVGAGVVVSGSNQDGIHITNGAANINNPSGAQTSFNSNAQHGIEVGPSTLGSVTITGTPGSPVPSNSGTVVAYLNTIAGIRINQTPGGAGLVTNSINGLVTWANGNYGARLFAGSLVKVRNSVFLGNAAYGILVSSGANSTVGNDTSNIDLGKVAATDPGKNWIQSPLGANNNSTGGLCVALTNCTAPGCVGPLTENVAAEGNEMVSNTGNLQVDCSTATTVITKGTCGGQRSDGINVATGITTTVDILGCQ
jgi:hypothetical protein